MANTKRSLSERLDDAVETMMKDPNAPLPSLDPKLTSLLRIAADLRDLPSEAFKQRLKTDLQHATPPPLPTPTASPLPEGVVRHIPAGHHSATPCLVVRDAPRAIEFYKRAFAATELMRFDDDKGTVMHAEILVGDSPIAIADEMPEWNNLSPQSLGGSPVVLQLYVDDVDAVAARAVEAGAKIIFPITDQFYGDRAGRLADPFGHVWIVATHKEDVTVDEMRRRAAAWMSEPGPAEAHTPEPSDTPAAERQGLIPYLQVRGAERLIDFVQQAFGGEELFRETLADGNIAHAEVRIGDAQISMADASTEYPPTQSALHLYVDDVDAICARAVEAGATAVYGPVDQPYGDREAAVKDGFGNDWYIATHKAGVHYTPEGMRSVTPYLHPHGADEMIAFLRDVFDAEEASCHRAPDGTVAHASIRIGDSMVEMGEAHGPYQPLTAAIHVYVRDTDTVYRRALAAGATSLFAPVDRHYGERIGGVKDPFGTIWYIATPRKG